MLVTHDMGVIAETADRVAVMYAGRIVEIGPVQEVIHDPQHPYTAGLMGSIPAVGQDVERLPQIEGSMPRLNAIPAGCAFNPRCPRVFDRCRVERPDLLARGQDPRPPAGCTPRAKPRAHDRDAPMDATPMRRLTRGLSPKPYRCSRCATSRATSTSRARGSTA